MVGGRLKDVEGVPAVSQRGWVGLRHLRKHGPQRVQAQL